MSVALHSGRRPASVLMLGGAGAMGRVAVGASVGFPSIERIVVADRDASQAETTANSAGEKVSSIGIDATDYEALVHLMKDFDIVVSTLGPYYRFCTHVLGAAIDAGTDYIDICDDWEPTLAMLALDEKAKSRGVRALIGAGASPGIANLLALKAVREIETVQTLYTGWGAGKRDDEGEKLVESSNGEPVASAAVEHWVHQFSGLIRVRENGIEIDQKPLQRHTLPHPAGGKCHAYSLGHPEPLTVPRYVEQIQHSYNVMDMPDFVMSLLRSLQRRIDKGEIDVRDAAIYLQKVTDGKNDDMRIIDSWRYIYHTAGEILRRKKYLPDLHATVVGEHSGRRETVMVHMNGRIEGGMGPMTCVPTSVFLSLMTDGSIARTGVYPPEAAVDPDEFFRRIAPHLNLDDPAHGVLRTHRFSGGKR